MVGAKVSGIDHSFLAESGGTLPGPEVQTYPTSPTRQIARNNFPEQVGEGGPGAAVVARRRHTAAEHTHPRPPLIAVPAALRVLGRARQATPIKIGTGRLARSFSPFIVSSTILGAFTIYDKRKKLSTLRSFMRSRV